MKNKKNKEYETVWTCDFCGEEFKTKKESDEHELICDKNPNNISFPLIRNIKKSWLVLWITTMVIFTITIYVNSKLFPQGLNLFNKKWFLNLFFGNIILGIIAFFGTVFSENKDKKKVFSVVKYSFILCLIYLICHAGIILSLDTSFKEQKEKSDYLTYQEPAPKTELQNVKYNGKVISGTVVNKSDKPIFNSKVVLKISKDRTAWNIDETHEFIVPYKIDPNQSINFTENYKTTKKDPWWTTLIQESHFYNNENVPTPSPTVTPRPTTVMVNCLISAECGGGSKLLAKSVCDNSTCCQITGKGWVFYQNKQDCIKDQNIANNTVKTVIPTTTNQVNTTNYPLCTVYYPALKYSQSYFNIPPSQCQQWQNEANKTASQNSYSTPTLYATPTLTESQAQAIIDQYNAQVTACRSQVNSNYNQKVQNCNIQFGDSSATEACTYAVNKERDSALINCGQTY